MRPNPSAFTIGMVVGFCVVAAAPARGQDKSKSDDSFSPAQFIEIYEDSANGRISVYRPGRNAATQLSVDENSTIVLIPAFSGGDLLLNNLYMSAALASADATTNLEVEGYAEIGAAREATRAQRGMRFESAANVQAMMLNLAYTVDDIIEFVYGPDDPNKGDEAYRQRLQVPATPEELARAEERFRLYRAEIGEISQFFVNEDNLSLIELIGTEVFWVDRASMQAIARQVLADVTVAFSEDGPAKRDAAMRDLLERTELIYWDFREIWTEIDQLARKQYPDCHPYLPKDFTPLTADTDPARRQLIQTYATQAYVECWRAEAFEKLKRLFAPGTISLRNAKAKDGDRLTVRIEARGAQAESVGIPAVFEVSVKKYGVKPVLQDSFLFIKRLDVDDEAKKVEGGTAPKAVNFAPSPGVTFGFSYHKRGERGIDKFVRGLSPGLGINVSFMNFDDPGSDLSTGQFTDTTGSTIQVGAGIAGMLFDNQLQLVYGWNLNARAPRSYFAIGFSFVNVTAKVGDIIKKQKK